jgi:hypothetical protein
MSQDIKKPDSSSFSSEIEKIVTSRNPLSILFWLAKIRSAFEDIANDLLSWIEKTYYEEKAADFWKLVQLYEKNGFYQIIGNYYADRGVYKRQKNLLDSYFAESFWRDIDFFFYVIWKFSAFKQVFSVVHYLYEHPELLGQYVSSDDTTTEDILTHILTALTESENTATKRYTSPQVVHDTLWDRAFLRIHVDILSKIVARFLTEETVSSNSFARSNTLLFMRDIYIYCVSNEYTEYTNYFKENMIENTNLQSVLIENLSNSQIGECYAYLRKKLLKTPKYNLELNAQNIYLQHIQLMLKMTKANTDVKLSILRGIQDTYGNYWPSRETFQNIVRKGLMYRGSLDMVDSSLGITFLTRSVFYQAKKKLVWVDMVEFQFEWLSEAGKLVDMLDSSMILRFFRPFFIWRLAQVFNKQKSDIYYFIKFVLTIHSTTTYWDYQKFSRFFLSLEAFEKRGWYGSLLVASQFGWIFIAGLLLYFLAPLWVFLAIVSIWLLHIIRRKIQQKLPELSLVSNFQLTTYITTFGVIFAILGFTVWLEDNTRIVYSNFQKSVNALILTSSEAIELIASDIWAKASIYEWNEKRGEGSSGLSKLWEVDYIRGVKYGDIVQSNER